MTGKELFDTFSEAQGGPMAIWEKLEKQHPGLAKIYNDVAEKLTKTVEVKGDTVDEMISYIIGYWPKGDLMKLYRVLYAAGCRI